LWEEKVDEVEVQREVLRLMRVLSSSSWQVDEVALMAASESENLEISR
jgi:hypothetical protein